MADLIVGETTCDGKRDVRATGRIAADARLELPQKAGDPDALAHWVRELEKFRGLLARRFQVAVADAGLREAIARHEPRAALAAAIGRADAADGPPLTGRQLLDFKSSISAIPADRSNMSGQSRFTAGMPRSPGGVAGPRADDRRADGRTAPSGSWNMVEQLRRAGRLPGELHGPEAACWRTSMPRRPIRWRRWPSITSASLPGHDPQRSPLGDPPPDGETIGRSASWS